MDISFVRVLKIASALAFLVLILHPPLLRGQEEFTRFEVGGHFTNIRQLNPSGKNDHQTSGFGGRLDINLTRRLALDAQVDFFPPSSTSFFQVQGGRTLDAYLGVRAKMLESKHFAVYGLLRPGLMHFTDVLEVSGTGPTFTRTAPETYFALNLGGGVEFYPSPRWIARFDICGNPYRIPNFRVSSGSGTLSGPGKIEDTERITVGVAYRLGALHEAERETPESGKLELGPQFTTGVIQREGALDGVRTEPGIGGYASYRFFQFFYADTSLTTFLRDTNSSGPHDGGRIFQGLFGLKGGIRRNRVGIFGKVRPGFNSYARALTSIRATPSGLLVFTFERSTNFVLDLGGIVEFYPTKHTTLRFDAGDTHIYFQTKNVIVDGTPTSAPGGERQHTIQFSVGYGWRF